MHSPVSTSSATQFDSAILAQTQELAPYGIFTTDRELVVTSWNAWLETHSGIRTEEATGRPLLELFAGLIARGLDERFRRALQGEVAVLSAAFHGYLFPFPSPLPTEELPHMLQTARIAPLLADGKICGTIALIEDVTQRERNSATLRQQEARDRLLSVTLQRLLEASDPKTVLTEVFRDLAAHLRAEVFVNHLVVGDRPELSLHAWAGLTSDQEQAIRSKPEAAESPGQPDRPLDAQPDPVQAASDALEHTRQTLGLKSHWHATLQVGDRFLGQLLFGSHTRESFDSADLEFARVICRHVSVALDRALTEQQLRRAHAELEQRVEERTARLQETVSQLESFSYTLAHDLRAPLRTMRGYAEVLLEELGEVLSPNQRQYLAKIRVAATGMELLTRDLLDFSKVSRERIQLTRVELGDVLDDVVLLTPGLHAPGVLTIHRPLPAVIAQPTLLQQCLANLLNNALKFVPADVQPRVNVRAELRAPCVTLSTGEARPAFQAVLPSVGPATGGASCQEVVRVWIEDNGIGIAPENHRKVFGIFERLQTREGYEGTGVGLAIVARSVHRMGGACGVESELGRGSRFWIELPWADAPGQS